MDEALDREVVEAVRRFVDRDVIPTANELEHNDEYPHALVAKMKELGLFGATIPQAHGGLGLSFISYARIMAELSRGWMSLAGVINSHLIMGYIIANHGTEEQKKRFLPAMAAGEKRGGLALTEPHAGSDVQSIKTTAIRQGDNYSLSGSKMFITNARHGTMLAVAAKTDPKAKPAYAGISMFAVEKNEQGPTVSRQLKKLGYKGIDTCEVLLEDLQVPKDNLIGGAEGLGFKQVMSALEVGRINVAARAVGVGQAAFDNAIRYAQQRSAFGKAIGEHQAVQLLLADMGTRSAGRAPDGRACGGQKRRRRTLRRRSRDGQALCFRSLRQDDPRRSARARRLWLYGRIPGRALLSRRAADDDWRGHQRDSGAGDCPRLAGAQPDLS